MLKLNPWEINKILIIRLSAIGDVVHCLPTLDILRRNFPSALISWAVDELSANLLEGHPYLDQVIVVPAYSLDRRLKKFSTFPQALREVKSLSKRLKEEKFDLVLDLHGLLKSGLVSYFTKAPLRLLHPLGRDFSHLFATHRVPKISSSPHVVENYLDTVRYLGLEVDRVNFPLGIGREEKDFAHRFLQAGQIKKDRLLIGLNPGASRFNKQWSPEKFALLGDELIKKYNCQIIIFGSPSDLSLVRGIASQMKNRPILAGGKTTLKELAALLGECALLVSGDTGPLHIAVAVQVPVVALFGPTDYQYSGPYTDKKQIITNHLPCAPCFGKGKCSKDTACIKNITVKQVLDGVKKLEPFFSPALPYQSSKP